MKMCLQAKKLKMAPAATRGQEGDREETFNRVPSPPTTTKNTTLIPHRLVTGSGCVF
jgi:hypothetical protein